MTGARAGAEAGAEAGARAKAGVGAGAGAGAGSGVGAGAGAGTGAGVVAKQSTGTTQQKEKQMNEAEQKALTTQSNEWELAAAQLDNGDVHVQVTQPLFDKQVKRVTFLAPERSDVENGQGTAVRMPFRIDEEITSTDGAKRAPGYVMRPFAMTLQPAGSDEKAVQSADRGRRDTVRILQQLKLLPKGDPELRAAYLAIPKVENVQAHCKFETVEGKKKDPATGKWVMFQNMTFSLIADGAKELEAPATGGVPENF